MLQLLNGVGPATAASVFEHVQNAGFNLSAGISFNAPLSARRELAELGALLNVLARMRDDNPSVQIERIHQFYGPILWRNYENPEPRENDIEYLSPLATGYSSRRQFLVDLILDPPTSTGDFAGPPIKDEDWLILSTIRSAKGLEWDAVYLIHATDGCLPSDMSTGSDEEIEEELRLTYVAMTRAKDFLYVLWPQRYYFRPFGLSDGHNYAQCSRFFTDEVMSTMDETMVGQTPRHEDASTYISSKDDVSKSIRYMWE